MPDLAPVPVSLPLVVGDEERLAALESYDILDTKPEPGFEQIVHLASLACNAPIALVSLVADDRQWFKARTGFPHSQTDLDSSVCAHALGEPDLLVIPDLAADPRTRHNPLVTGDAPIRFYAGAPLRAAEGHALGSLCVIDREPRPAGLTTLQADMLRSLAQQVTTLLEMRQAISGRDRFIARRRRVEEALGETAAQLRMSEAHWRGMFERLHEGFLVGELVRDEAGKVADWRYLDVNPAWSELVGIERADVVGRTIREVLPDIEDAWVDDFAAVVETGEPAVFTRQAGMLQRWYEGRAFPLDGDRFAVLFLEVTHRIQADLRRNTLLEVGDQLRDLSTVEDMTRAAAAAVGQALGVTRAGFGRLSDNGEDVLIEPDWTAPGTPSIAGQHRFADWGDINRGLLLGQPLVISDAQTDPRTADDRGRWHAAHIRALVNIPIRERGRTVAVFIVHDSTPRNWDEETVGFLRNIADRLMAAVGRFRAEERQEVLNQELSHRMKNMLAMIQAIAGQTLKGVTEQNAVDDFQHRLLALSSAHDVLLRKDWAAAPMHEVVEAVLGRLGQPDQFMIDGPGVMLGPRAALSVSLLLHELGTNAAKYGALLGEAGRVTACWHIDPATDELVFSWREAGGPPAVEPSRKGFGSRLLRVGLIGTGGVALRYLPTGFEADMRAKLEQVQAT